MSTVSAAVEPMVDGLSHPLLRALSGSDAAAALDELSPSAVPAEHELDGVEDPETTFTVLDADGGQRLCLEAAARGNSFVLCGPPGTGKCQTIVNLIAAFLARHKTVLCVGPRRATLERIADRLRTVGLADFVLRLGNSQSDAGQLTAEVSRSLQNRPTPGEASALNLARLRECRDGLARYAEALHRVRQPLGRSVWSALCELAPLHNVPLAPLGLEHRPAGQDAGHVPGIEDFNAAWLEEARQTLKRSQQLWHIRAQTDFPWRGFKAERYTQQLRDEVLALLERVRSRADRVLEAIGKFGEQAGVTAPLPILLQLGELLDAKPAALPAAWLEETDVDRLDQELQECARQYRQLGQSRAPLTERYGPALWILPVGTATNLERAWQTAAPLLAPGDERGAALLTDQQPLRGWAADTQKRIPGWIADARTVEKWLAVPLPPGAGAETSPRTGGEAKTDPSVTSLRALLRLANLCQTDNPPERTWVQDPDALSRTRTLIADNRPAFTDYRQRRAKLLEIYRENFFELELERIAAGFAGPYQSWLRFFNGQYRRDRRALARRSRSEAMPATVAQDVKEALTLLAEKARLESEGPQRQPVLGRYEKGLETDFDAAERATRVAADAVDLVRKLGSTSLPGRLLDNLCAKSPAPDKVRAAAKRLHDSLSAWLHATHELKAQLPSESLPGTGQPLEESALSALNRFARDLQTSLNQVGSLTDPLLAQAPARPADTVTLVEDLKRAEEVRALEGSRETEAAGWSHRLGPAFQGLSTDWEALRKALAWLRRLRDRLHQSGALATKGSALARFSQLPTSGSLPSARELRHALEQYQQALHTLEHRFEAPGPLFDGKRLGEHGPDQVKQRLGTLRDRIAELADWIDWQHLPDRFGHLGLGAFWAELLAHPPGADEVLALFLKSFWHTWYTATAQQEPALADFDRDRQEQTRAEFQSLDRQWLHANRQRVRRRVVENWPSNESASLLGQGNRASIRDLFDKHADALLRIKPCVLAEASALSAVSGAGVSFDLVILTDASHLGLEEVTLPISRGRQVVIVGDDHEPALTAGHGSGAAPAARASAMSLLQRCLKAGLPRYELPCNYAARHEALVAFASRQVFDDRLVSFPAAHFGDANLGVDVRHVADGTADAAGANRREAQAVAELVIDHLRDRASRSIAVLTLSAAQAAAIDVELGERLRTRPELDDALQHDGPGAFFIKTVDQAGGETRDVIVLSVGYARDAGRPPRDFGLLSLKDGERSLYPALGAAMEKLHIVSSLRAADIEIKPKTGAGVSLLRDLLAYAESPFSPIEKGNVHALAREVARDLESRGHHVTFLVGHSARPVELAIAEPQDAGRFLLAVDFDGLTYQAARTVRDRERLRPEALQARGWAVHRVWTPAWIADRQTEVERLCGVLEKLQKRSPLAP